MAPKGKGKKDGKLPKEEESDYEVEAIVDERMKAGIMQYFVKWLNFEEKHNTWEPEENLIGCPGPLNKWIAAKEDRTSVKGPKKERDSAQLTPARPSRTRQPKDNGSSLQRKSSTGGKSSANSPEIRNQSESPVNGNKRKLRPSSSSAESQELEAEATLHEKQRPKASASKKGKAELESSKRTKKVDAISKAKPKAKQESVSENDEEEPEPTGSKHLRQQNKKSNDLISEDESDTECPGPVGHDKQGEFWEVERVIGAAMVRGKLQFLVKWKNWPDEENTWEPQSYLKGSPAALSEFFRKHSKPTVKKNKILSEEGKRYEEVHGASSKD